MRPIIMSIILSCTLILTNCIEPYVPTISKSLVNKYVVFGQILDVEGYQSVKISLTSPLENPGYLPLSDCSVKILDSRGKEFDLSEYELGSYRVWMDSADLTSGVGYQLKITTTAGVRIVSDFDIMNECPNVDSVYYEREDLPTNSPSVFDKGIQFYIDLNAANTSTRFFKWEVEETFEHRAVYPRELYYDGTWHIIDPPDYSTFTCWSTLDVKDIFTLTTQNFAINAYKRHPLHFVDNKTSRLLYGYSLLIKQYSLSEAAYNYWEQLRINSKETGGLYEKQPLPMIGNLKNITNPEQGVLGLFFATSVKNKRIFVRNVSNLNIEYMPFCSPDTLWFGTQDIEPREYPAYIIYLKNKMCIEQPSCYDCREDGGINIKPDFWPY
jgi:hypothetical protein